MRYMRQDGHTYTGPINAAMRCAITLCSGHHYSLAPSRPPPCPHATPPSGSHTLTLLLHLCRFKYRSQGTCVTSHASFFLMKPFSASVTSRPEAHRLLRPPAPPPSRRPHIAAPAVGAAPPHGASPPAPSFPFLPRTKASVPSCGFPANAEPPAPQKYFIYSRFFPSIQCIIHPL